MTYYTVSEFAKKAGVSVQAVYQRIYNQTIQSHTIPGKRGKYIAAEELDKFAVARDFEPQIEIPDTATETANNTPNPFQEPPSDVSQAPQTRENEKAEFVPEKETECLQRALETLREVIEQQREELKEKTQALEERDRLISEYADKFASLASDALQTVSQAQTLHAVSESGRLTNASQNGSESLTEQNKGESREEQRGFFTLFGRKKRKIDD